MIFSTSGYQGHPASANGVPESRLTRLTRGINITRWFALDPDNAAASHFTGYLGDDDLQLIHDLGFRFVRLAIDPGALYHPETPTRPDPTMLGYIDAALDRFFAHDLAAIVDIHYIGKQPFEQDAGYVDGYVLFWGALAEHFSALDPEMVFLEPLNEPVFQKDPGQWPPIQQRLIAAIRAKAPQHTLIVTGALWGGIDGLFRLPLVGDPNVLYSFHFYEPMAFTHQGAGWAGAPYPALRNLPYPSNPEVCADILHTITDPLANQAAVEYCKTSPWTPARIDGRIAQAAGWATARGVHVFVGEFGVYCPVTPPDSRLRWLQDAHTSFEKHGIGWTLWGYDDCFGLGRERKGGQIIFDRDAASALGLEMPPEAS